jgi:hypothetical protein
MQAETAQKEKETTAEKALSDNAKTHDERPLAKRQVALSDCRRD